MTSMQWMFLNCEGLISIDLNDWDTSSLLIMSSAFKNCIKLTTVNISDWNTSNVTDMKETFAYCTTLESIDLSKWDTHNVKDMETLFAYCFKLTTLDLSNWNTSNVTKMGNMFVVCKKLTTIFASENFNTDAVTNSVNMFYDCGELVGGNGTAYNYDHRDKEYARIDGKDGLPGYFREKPPAYTVEFVVNAPEGTTATGTMNPQRIEIGQEVQLNENTFEVEGYKFVEWNTEANGSGISYTNEQAVSDLSTTNGDTITLYAQWSVNVATFDIGKNVNLAIRKLVNPSANIFDSNNEPGPGDFDYTITRIERSNNEPTTDDYVEVQTTESSSSIKMWLDGTTVYWYSEVAKPKLNSDSSLMFAALTELVSQDITDECSMSNVTNLSGAFAVCTSLNELNTSTWDTSNVIDLSSTFFNCISLTTIDVSNWNTSSLKYLIATFSNCTNLENLNVSKWDTHNVQDMDTLFYNCLKLTTLDLSNWNTSNVTNMNNMFFSCKTLTTVFASENFNTDAVTISANMFYDCVGLVGENGTTYDTSHINKEYARIDAEGTPGYFTAKPGTQNTQSAGPLNAPLNLNFNNTMSLNNTLNTNSINNTVEEEEEEIDNQEVIDNNVTNNNVEPEVVNDTTNEVSEPTNETNEVLNENQNESNEVNTYNNVINSTDTNTNQE